MAKPDGPINTRISTAYVDRIEVRGHDLCDDLIGKIGMTDYFVLLLTGQAPSDDLRIMLDACFVAIAEHGLTSSILSARSTYNAAPDALQGAVAAGLLGCGPVVLGASEEAGKLIAQVNALVDETTTVEMAAQIVCTEIHQSGRILPGFGHPMHKPVDPRAQRLLALSHEIGSARPRRRGARGHRGAGPGDLRPGPAMNAPGAIAGVLLDAGFPAQMLRSVSMIARTFGIVAHLLEEANEPNWYKVMRLVQANTVYQGDPAGTQGGGAGE